MQIGWAEGEEASKCLGHWTWIYTYIYKYVFNYDGWRGSYSREFIHITTFAIQIKNTKTNLWKCLPLSAETKKDNCLIIAFITLLNVNGFKINSNPCDGHCCKTTYNRWQLVSFVFGWIINIKYISYFSVDESS